MESPETSPLRRDYCYLIRSKFTYVTTPSPPSLAHVYFGALLLTLTSECGCLDNGTELNHQAMDNTAYAYNAGLMQITQEWQAKNLTDFYVTAIPFLRTPLIDISSDLVGIQSA